MGISAAPLMTRGLAQSSREEHQQLCPPVVLLAFPDPFPGLKTRLQCPYPMKQIHVCLANFKDVTVLFYFLMTGIPNDPHWCHMNKPGSVWVGQECWGAWHSGAHRPLAPDH